MSSCVNLCLIWILCDYSWRSFYKILCNDARERPNSLEHLRRGFLRLLPTESLTTSTLLGYFAVSQPPAKCGIFCLISSHMGPMYIESPYTNTHTHTHIYSHPQTDCFVVSQVFGVGRHVGRLKLGSKPAQLYDRLSIRPLSQQAYHVS